MNEQQRLYLIQARSDWRMVERLKDEPVCHRLLYLQMCTEKLAKAYFWNRPDAAVLGHAAFSRFVRAISNNRLVAQHLGFAKTTHFREWIREVSGLVQEIERLAPALAEDGPNPEYPWPRLSPLHAPVEQPSFTVWEHLRTPNGQNLWRMIEQLFIHFETWF